MKSLFRTFDAVQFDGTFVSLEPICSRPDEDGLICVVVIDVSKNGADIIRSGKEKMRIYQGEWMVIDQNNNIEVYSNEYLSVHFIETPLNLQTKSFQQEIESCINKHCMENGSNTPDFILADYLLKSLTIFNETALRRDRHYGIDVQPGYGVKAADEI